MRHSWKIVAAAVAVCAAFASAAMGEDPVNLIENPGFEDGVLHPWNKYGAAAVATVVIGKQDVHTGKRALKIEVAEKGVNFWDAGLQYRQAGVVFEEGVLYTWSFFAKSDPPVEVNLKPELGAGPVAGFRSQARFS